MRPFVVALTLSGVLAGLAAACAPVTPPPPPPPTDFALTPSQDGWRREITAADTDRLSRLDAAWTQALTEARTQAGSGDLAALGELTDPDATRPGVMPPPAPTDAAPSSWARRAMPTGSAMSSMAGSPAASLRTPRA